MTQCQRSNRSSTLAAAIKILRILMSNPLLPAGATAPTLSLTEDELAFFKAQTKIDDEDELKNHISAVRAKAYNIYPYRCIATFIFTK